MSSAQAPSGAVAPPAAGPPASTQAPEQAGLPAPLLRAVRQAEELAEAVLAGDEPRALELVLELTAPDFDRPEAPLEVVLLGRTMEVAAQALLGFLLTEQEQSGCWRRVLLPDANGLFEANGIPLLAIKLRTLGSDLMQLAARDVLDLDHLARLDLRGQALLLGRYTIVHDAGCPDDCPELAAGPPELDLERLRQVLDPRLHPYLDEWVLTTYAHSPLRLVDDETNARQDAAIRSILASDACRRESVPVGSAQSRSAFHAPYRADGSVRTHAELINGGRMRSLFERFAPLPHEEPHQRSDAEALGYHDALVVCPNWHEHHVIYRCMGPLTRGLIEDGQDTLALRVPIDTQQGRKPAPEAWRAHHADLAYDHRFALSDLDALCRGLARSAPDLVFYPEIVPVNSSAWMATRRIGRVQATGYGFPVTSGLAAMDYFVGGLEVETGDHALAAEQYTEDLVLIPGMGVCTTEPPPPSRPRERPVDDGHVRLMTISSRLKLNRELLRAWDAIQADQAGTCLTLFSNIPPGEADRWAEPMVPLLGHGEADLRTATPRQLIIDELEDADVYLDAFPFGGFNTLVEVLCAGCPVVTLEGQSARNRFGAAILRRLDLPEFLITHSYAEYVEVARRLVADAGLRRELRERIGGRERVLRALNDPDQGAHFAAAARYMRERGPRTQADRSRRRGPVLVEAGSAPRRLTP